MAEALPQGSWPVTRRDGRRPRCPTAFCACASCTWKNKLLLIACPYGSGQEEIAHPLAGAAGFKCLSVICLLKNTLSKHREISREGWWLQTPECGTGLVGEERSRSQPLSLQLKLVPELFVQRFEPCVSAVQSTGDLKPR